jgi:hypothetical protein
MRMTLLNVVVFALSDVQTLNNDAAPTRTKPAKLDNVKQSFGCDMTVVIG